MNGAWKKFAGEGYKGYLVGGNLTLAKNMVAQVEYYDLEGKETENTRGPFGLSSWSRSNDSQKLEFHLPTLYCMFSQSIFSALE